MIRRRLPIETTSSTIAVGVATAFLVFAAALSFVGDPVDATTGWRLRGTLAPVDVPAPLRLPPTVKPV